MYDLLLHVRIALVLASQSQSVGQAPAAIVATEPGELQTPEDQSQQQSQQQQQTVDDAQECPVSEPSQGAPATENTPELVSEQTWSEPSLPPAPPVAPAPQPMPVCPDSGEIEPPDSVLLPGAAPPLFDEPPPPPPLPPPPPPAASTVSSAPDEITAPASLTTITIPAVELSGPSAARLEQQRNEIEHLRILCECNERSSQMYALF